MSEKYRIYKSIYKEEVKIKEIGKWQEKTLTNDELTNLDIKDKKLYELYISDKFIKDELVKEIEVDEILDVGDDFLINDIRYSVRSKVFNMDFNCYNLYTNKYDTIDLDEDIKKIFIQKYEALKEQNQRLELERKNKEDEIYSNTITGRWSDFKDKLRKLIK